MNEHNPWDKTIWDPANPEHAIEDPLHGPTAVHNSLQIPPMPCGDGTYYQPGAYYATGFAYIDSIDRPVFKIRSTSTSAGMREIMELEEWINAYRQGEDTLVTLEAGRQQKRLTDKGFADCYKTTDVCPGGKRLEDCEPGNAAFTAVQECAARLTKGKTGDGNQWTIILNAGATCVGCALSCEAAVKTEEGKATETRVRFYKIQEPDPSVPAIHITIKPLEPIKDPHIIDIFKRAVEKLNTDKQDSAE